MEFYNLFVFCFLIENFRVSALIIENEKSRSHAFKKLLSDFSINTRQRRFSNGVERQVDELKESEDSANLQGFGTSS